jgi:glycosyltransferase involved in cell wall biosynthesis
VKYIKHENNKNGSAARNTGWRNAHGEYITYLDDDDEISPNKIKAQVECLEALDESWGACYTSYHILMENGRIQHSATNQSGDVYLRALMRTFYMGSGSNVLLRKSVVDEIGGYDESFRRNQDIEFMARAFENYKVAYVPQDLLTIHMEVRAIKRTFDFVDGVTLFYLEKFSTRINRLSKQDKHKVLSVITLERARVACNYKEYMAAKEMLTANNVTMIEIVRYLIYLVKRYVTKKSYGFYLK